DARPRQPPHPALFLEAEERERLSALSPSGGERFSAPAPSPSPREGEGRGEGGLRRAPGSETAGSPIMAAMPPADAASPIRTGACIVGGGPAGLMLGLLLAKRGAPVIVLEGHENFDREFRGEVLQPSTAHLLDELGLLEYVRAQPHSTLTAGIIR